MRVTDFAGTEPRFRPETYFNGRTRAWGIFQDRFGRLKREFSVDISGVWDGTVLEMTEDFAYADGGAERRVWRIRKLDDHRYEGRADDVIGVARGERRGKALNWRYDLRLPMNGRRVTMHFDDWMFLQDDEVMINRATVSKFGIALGEVTLFFRRDVRGDSPSPAPDVDRKAAA